MCFASPQPTVQALRTQGGPHTSKYQMCDLLGLVQNKIMGALFKMYQEFQDATAKH